MGSGVDSSPPSDSGVGVDVGVAVWVGSVVGVSDAVTSGSGLEIGVADAFKSSAWFSTIANQTGPGRPTLGVGVLVSSGGPGVKVGKTG